MSNIEERVKKIIAEQLGVKEEEVINAASFVEDLGADSLDTVELVMALEEEFETEIQDTDRLLMSAYVIDCQLNSSDLFSFFIWNLSLKQIGRAHV